MNLAPIVKLGRAYDATEWEIFISEWQKGLSGYTSVKRLGGSGDQGRDVIGLCSSAGCQGVWDNYQCKHYESRFRRLRRVKTLARSFSMPSKERSHRLENARL